MEETRHKDKQLGGQVGGSAFPTLAALKTHESSPDVDGQTQLPLTQDMVGGPKRSKYNSDEIFIAEYYLKDRY